MKKIITLLIFLFAGVTLAQTYTPYDKTEGRYWRAYKDTLLASYVYVANDSTSKAKLDSIIAKLTALATPIATISNATSSLNPMDIYGGGTTTADTSDVDTVFFRQGAVNASTYATLEVTTVDSVLQLSFDGFTTNIDVVLGSPIKIEKIAVATFPKFYIRKKVATGTANYRYFWYGY